MSMGFLKKLVGKDKNKDLSTTKARAKAQKHAWKKWELEILDVSFKDLSYRSSHDNVIDKEVFLKFFLNVPGMLGERLFFVFDRERQGFIDKSQFLDGLYRFSRGNYEDKLRFVFDMFDIDDNKSVSTKSLEAMLNSVLFAAHTINSEIEITDEKIRTMVSEAKDMCTPEEREEDKMRLYSFGRWLGKHPLMLDVLDAVFAGHDRSDTSDNKTHSLSSVLMPRSNTEAEAELQAQDAKGPQTPHHPTRPARRSLQFLGGVPGINLAEGADDSDIFAMRGIKLECGACESTVTIANCYKCGKKLAATSTAEAVSCVTCGPIFLDNHIKCCMTCGHNYSHQLDGKVEPSLVKSIRHKRDLTRMEGMMRKIGSRFHNIINRWFVIRDNFLYAYNKQTDQIKGRQPTSILFLEGCYIEAVNHEEKNSKLKYGLEIIITENPRRTRLLYCAGAEERKEWLRALQAAANVHNIEDYYELGRELGVGRFSTVKLGKSKVNGKQYAIKIMDKNNMDEKENEALRTEVAVLKLVSHPNVIRLKNVFETRRQIHIVMTYIEGGDLFDLLEEKKTLSERAARALTVKLLEVIQYLHARAIVHRDLKPENIMMRSAKVDDVTLTDFGLSKFSASHEAMDVKCGTLAYVAPEVLQNKGYGKEVDLWSIGVILYLCIRGRLPFDSKNPQEIIAKTIEGKIPFDHEVFTKVSSECISLIKDLLRTDPKKRCDVAQALKHPWFKKEDVGALREHEKLLDESGEEESTQTVLDELDQMLADADATPRQSLSNVLEDVDLSAVESAVETEPDSVNSSMVVEETTVSNE